METSSDFEYELDEGSCLVRDECIESLVAEAPAVCLYCQFELMDGQEWD
jgi:hypothetical protein